MSEELSESRVLVIDDELGPRESIRFLLNRTHLVSSAASVDQGIELLIQHVPADDAQRVPEIVDELRRGLPERGEVFLVLELALQLPIDRC